MREENGRWSVKSIHESRTTTVKWNEGDKETNIRSQHIWSREKWNAAQLVCRTDETKRQKKNDNNIFKNKFSPYPISNMRRMFANANHIYICKCIYPYPKRHHCRTMHEYEHEHELYIVCMEVYMGMCAQANVRTNAKIKVSHRWVEFSFFFQKEKTNVFKIAVYSSSFFRSAFFRLPVDFFYIHFDALCPLITKFVCQVRSEKN